MSAQEHTHPGPDDTGGHPRGGPKHGRLDDWDLDADDIGEISGRGNARLRQLTPIRGLSGEALDPVVEDALRDVRRELVELLKKHDKTIDDVRRELASHYLNVTEKVTSRLNRQALPRATRTLLAIDGMYEHLLLSALKRGIGTTPPHDSTDTHTHAAAAALSPTQAPGV
jgi:hypothetical protein